MTQLPKSFTDWIPKYFEYFEDSKFAIVGIIKKQI